MYYEEKQIEGVWYYRHDPKGAWKKMSLEQILRKERNALYTENETLKLRIADLESLISKISRLISQVV